MKKLRNILLLKCAKGQADTDYQGQKVYNTSIPEIKDVNHGKQNKGAPQSITERLISR